MIRVLLVDDEDIARERLRQMLASIVDLEVAGEAAGRRRGHSEDPGTAARFDAA